MGTKDPPLNKDNSRAFELSSQPGTAGAATYKVAMRVLQGDEDLRSKLIWAKDCNNVLAGLNIVAVTPALTLLSSVMSETFHGHLTLAVTTRAELNKEAAIKTAEDAGDDEEKGRAEARPVDECRTLDNIKNAITPTNLFRS